MNSQTHLLALIQTWRAVTADRAVDTGPSVDDATGRARELLEDLSLRRPITLAIDSENIDVFHAMCRCLGTGEFAPEVFQSAYDLVEGLPWQRDDFGERDDVIAKLAYAAWNDCRRRGDYRAINLWRRRCVSAVRNQEIVRDFLALPFASRSSNLNARFLSEFPIVLTSCVALEDARNTRPDRVAPEAVQLYKWVESVLEESQSDELNYFAGDVALSTAICCRHLGSFREHHSWLKVARSHFAATIAPEPLLARVRWCELAVIGDLHRQDEIVNEIPALTEAFRRYGMAEDELKSIFFEANALKVLGRYAAALRRLHVVRDSTSVSGDALLHGLSLVFIAEATAQLGQPELALESLERARPIIERTGSVLGLGNLYAVTAEVLKNEDRLGDAITEYGKAIAVYQTSGMALTEAYTRVLRAETLLAAEREGEAIADLVAALPVLEREDVLVDAVAALALLKESMRRQKADRHVVKKLGAALRGRERFR